MTTPRSPAIKLAIRRIFTGWMVTRNGREVPGRGPYPDEKALAERLGMTGLPDVWPAGLHYICQEVHRESHHQEMDQLEAFACSSR
jgi:hypothetical protein